MSLIWWEKTVEYQFVLLVVQANKLFIAPLDGAHERAGDTIFSSNNRWVLIEFKKNAKSIATEKAKFDQYAIAHAALASIDDHHYIVYGDESKSIQRLQLYSQTYFSATGSVPTKILNSGYEFDAFKQYVEQYTKFKKGSKGDSGGGGLSMDKFTLVAGVNADNNTVVCLSLSEFQQQLGLENSQKQSLSRRRDGPSF